MEYLTVSADGVFYTLQGEGATLGCPVVFLRLHYCNLDCSWCDTAYTWNRALPEFHEYKRKGRWTIEETAKRIIEADKSGCQHLVITGGEPLLQQGQIALLLQQLPNWTVEIETNGTVVPQEELFGCQFNCSPKLSNAGITPARAINPAALNVLKGLNSYFKFVIQRAEDVEEMQRLYGESFHLPKERIILSPECLTLEEMIPLMRQLADIAKQEGYRLTPRLHILLWGNQRKT